MSHHHQFGICRSGIGCSRHIVSLALFLGTFVAVSWLTHPTNAAWETSHITVGDGKGGSTSYPAQKQSFKETGYSNVIPFGPGQMDNGEVIMTASLETQSTITPVVSFSSDQGNTWSPFKEELPPIKKFVAADHRPTMLIYLGGGNLTLCGGSYFSSDYGKTWSVQRQGSVDERYAENEGNAAVDLDANGKAVRVMETGWNVAHEYDASRKSPSGWPIEGYRTSFRYSLDGAHSWQGEVSPPIWTFQDMYKDKSYPWGTTEGALVRAANGWLVAALRTDPPSRFQVGGPAANNDNLGGTAVSISKDNGVTWSPLNRLFDAGRHHANLQRLPNGDLLMTMIVRDDIQFGGGLVSDLRGEDALVSHDNGLTWNLDRRITLDAFSHVDPVAPFDQSVCGHIATTVLTDGSVLTAYGNYLDSSAVMIKWNPAVIESK